MTTTAYEPRLFTSAHRRHRSARDGAAVSSRAAFQDALHGRATLIDIRSAQQRREAGVISPRLAPVHADLTTLGGQLAQCGDSRVILVDEHGEASREISDSLRRFGRHHVLHLGGGFAAWVRDGMPVGPPRG